MYPLHSIPLFSGPSRGTSVRSSEDGVLAVALENGVALLPSYQEVPRAICELPGRRPVQIKAEVESDSGNRKLSVLLMTPRCGARVTPQALQKSETSSHDWSPVGLSNEGGSLLAVLTRDNQVRGSPFLQFGLSIVPLSSTVSILSLVVCADTFV